MTTRGEDFGAQRDGSRGQGRSYSPRGRGQRSGQDGSDRGRFDEPRRGRPGGTYRGTGRDQSEPRDRAQRHRDAKGRERSGSRGKSGARAGWSEHRPSERAREAAPTRRAAWEAMREVSAHDAYANLVFPKVLRAHGLHGRDAAFTTELFYGTLRAKRRLDAVISCCVTRPLDRVDEDVLDVLRLGAYQLLDMNVPPHAATSETVALARQATGAGSAQFVNAVLRAIGRKDAEAWLDEILPERVDDEIEYLALKHSHPTWIVRALSDALAGHGRDRNELEDLLVAQNRAPKVDLVVRPGLSDLDELMEYGAGAGRLSQFAAYWPSGDPSGITPVREGRAAIQDEGSQLMALALALGVDTLVTSPSPHWLDLCAGPGGKTALLGGLTVDHDADLLATEIQPHRADLVQRGVRALVEAGCDIEVEAADGRDIGTRYPERFSRILADVPCTGLGALRRRPESRWRRQLSDVGPLTVLQRELLLSAVDALAPGGVLAYVTCSPHLAETLLVVKDLLRRRQDVRQLDAREAVRAGVHSDAQIDLGAGPSVQLWPHVHGTDGMFIALFTRESSPT
ncbi:RsmB/NOP family class I SAM-dependent RNA methyltransferase [Devriesea agamarum]|uniref:RsmB/NOP family class I SAM-dependent RNA methyltransferase n=1 Tax=Devriesea agamarum TaxID=472569 RepID=UPI000A01A298|nr:transcription antitermination factor NusB [Devriesea agamarum]